MISRKKLGIFLTFMGALIVIIHTQFVYPELMYTHWIGGSLFFIGPLIIIPDYIQKKPNDDL
ncbi:hypothetical protein [Bacillus sp. V5-8f]|uniref:hypothetical protein n=1 Tax=Bacillus sp. V5-8f TaxID=2053044 RepID=UPI000C7789A3|nr:hypothetical protein [Bacillus sp. V5-8f]PLT32846.1 hypothetical protein CUU64_17070 [Bacillus sp. V5-8f]